MRVWFRVRELIGLRLDLESKGEEKVNMILKFRDWLVVKFIRLFIIRF